MLQLRPPVVATATPQVEAVAVVAEGAKEPVDLEDDDDEEEEAEVAFAVLVEQGKEVAAEASRASSSI